MTRGKRLASLTVGGAGVLILTGLAITFRVIGLDDADKLSSAIGLFVTILGLAVSVYGVLLARRATTGPPPAQRVTGSTVGGDVTQISGVGGNVRVGRATTPTPGPAVPAHDAGQAPAAVHGAGQAPAAVHGAGQEVAGAGVGGAVHQIDRVDGDVDVHRPAEAG